MMHVRTARLRLEVVSPSNATTLWQLMQSPGLREHQDIPRYACADFVARVRSRPSFFDIRTIARFEWIVRDRAIGEPMGWVSLRSGEHPRGMIELGYTLLEAYRGQGFATEAITALIGYAFEQEGVEVLEACCVPENRASWRVLERIGFRARAPATSRGDRPRPRGRHSDLSSPTFGVELVDSGGVRELDANIGAREGEVAATIAAEVGE